MTNVLGKINNRVHLAKADLRFKLSLVPLGTEYWFKMVFSSNQTSRIGIIKIISYSNTKANTRDLP